MNKGKTAAPFECQFCGQPSFLEPSDQPVPVDYCHPEDHGCAEDFEEQYGFAFIAEEDSAPEA